MTRRFVSAKRLIRYFSNSSKLVEHRAQSRVREVKMLAVCPTIAGMFLAGQIKFKSILDTTKINKTHGNITTSKIHYSFDFYFIPHLVMLQWTSFEKCLFLMLYSISLGVRQRWAFQKFLIIYNYSLKKLRIASKIKKVF